MPMRKSQLFSRYTFNLHSAAYASAQIEMKVLTSGCFFDILYLRKNILQSTVGGVVEELPENSILISVRIIFQAQISGAIEPVR